MFYELEAVWAIHTPIYYNCLVRKYLKKLRIALILYCICLYVHVYIINYCRFYERHL